MGLKPLNLLVIAALGGGLLSGCGKERSPQDEATLVPVATVDQNVAPVTEGSGTAVVFRIILSQPSSETVNVGFDTVSGTAVHSQDYNGVPQFSPINTDPQNIATFPPGTTSYEVEIELIDDNRYENDENFFLVLRAAERAVLGREIGARATIADNDTAPELTLALDQSRNIDTSEALGGVPIKFSLPTGYTAPERDITVPLVLSGTATNGSDYDLPSEIVIPAYQALASYAYTVELLDDLEAEGVETLILDWGPGTNAITDNLLAVTINIASDDTANGTLTDTGITQCQNETQVDAGACGAGGPFPNQDADFVTPFNLTAQALSSNVCVSDNNTGLMWTTKNNNTNSGQVSLQESDHTYAWFNPNDNINGGSEGKQRVTDSTATSGCDQIQCDTQNFVQRINTANICGFNDWRLPKLHELLSLVDYSAADSVSGAPAADPLFNIIRTRYWTASSSAANPTYAWTVNFADGSYGIVDKESVGVECCAAILVRTP